MPQDFRRVQHPDRLFNAMQNLAISIWGTYNDDYWYASEKIAIVKSINNVRDNIWYIYSMFDSNNQAKLDRLAKEQYPELYDLIQTMHKIQNSL